MKDTREAALVLGNSNAGDGPAGGLFDRFDKWSTFFLANLVWVLLAPLVVTLPLGTVGMTNVMSMWVRGKQPEFFKDFFGGIRRLWWKAMLIGLLDLLVGGLVYANVLILSSIEINDVLALLSRSVTFFVALMLLMTNVYIWALLVVAEFGLRRVLEMSLKLVLAHPLASLGTLVAGLLPPVLAFLLGLPALFWLLGLVSFSALILNWGAWRVIRRYVPEAELSEYESRV